MAVVQVGKGESEAHSNAFAAPPKDTLTSAATIGVTVATTGPSVYQTMSAPYRGPPTALPDHPGCNGDFPGDV